MIVWRTPDRTGDGSPFQDEIVCGNSKSELKKLALSGVGDYAGF